jgi:hypothetical protein
LDREKEDKIAKQSIAPAAKREDKIAKQSIAPSLF